MSAMQEARNEFAANRRLPSKDEIETWAKEHSFDAVLKLLDDLSEDASVDHRECGVLLTCVSELLFLRSGATEVERDAAKSDVPEVFTSAMVTIKDGNLYSGMKKLRSARLHCSSSSWLELSLLHSHAVHMAVNAKTGAVVGPLLKAKDDSPSRPQPPVGQWVVAEAPARIDLAGGWTDTPPVCFERKGMVAGVAVTLDGKRPITCRARRTEQRRIRLTLLDAAGKVTHDLEIGGSDAERQLSCSDPKRPGALLKACVAVSGLVDIGALGETSLEKQLESKVSAGIELESRTLLPEGSGLGTSSILAGCLLAALWTTMGRSYSHADLVYGVLLAEQYLSTGGGWQDNVHGLCAGGFKVGESGPGSGKVLFRPLEVGPKIRESFSRRAWLLLPKKDVTRLAKPILWNVIKRWYFRDRAILDAMEENYNMAQECTEALRKDDFSAFADVHGRYWRCKKFLSEGANPEPEVYRRVAEELGEDLMGYSLAGAGGGGFMVALLREGAECPRALVERMARARPELDCSVHELGVDEVGVTVRKGGEVVRIEESAF